MRLLPILPFLLLSSLAAQTVELQSGEVIVGRLVAMQGDRLAIEAGYPKAERRELGRAEVLPRSWFALLAMRADLDSVTDLLALADEAERLGLPAHALAQLQAAAQLDQAQRPQLEQRMASLREAIAAALLGEAEQALADGRWAEARLGAEVVRNRYADTPAGGKAGALMTKALAAARTDAASRAADATTAQKALATAARHEAEADKVALPLRGGIGATVKEQKAREKAIGHLERARAALLDGGDGQDVTAVRIRVTDKLRDSYLAIARTLLQRRALDQATHYNALACELDPDGGGCSHLQDLIVQARLSFGY